MVDTVRSEDSRFLRERGRNTRYLIFIYGVPDITVIEYQARIEYLPRIPRIPDITGIPRIEF